MGLIEATFERLESLVTQLQTLLDTTTPCATTPDRSGSAGTIDCVRRLCRRKPRQPVHRGDRGATEGCPAAIARV